MALGIACEQAHLIGKGGGAAIASRRSRREEWGAPFLAPFFSPASPLAIAAPPPCLSSEPARRLLLELFIASQIIHAPNSPVSFLIFSS